jgi:hypothetical protein
MESRMTNGTFGIERVTARWALDQMVMGMVTQAFSLGYRVGGLQPRNIWGPRESIAR